MYLYKKSVIYLHTTEQRSMYRIDDAWNIASSYVRLLYYIYMNLMDE